MTSITVCGICDTDNIFAIESLGIERIGFVFMANDPREMKMIPSLVGFLPDYTREQIERRKGELLLPSPEKMQRIGIFKNDMPQNIITRVYNFELNTVQLEGDEDTVCIDNLRRTIVPDIHTDIHFIKTVSIASAADFKACTPFEGHVDEFVFNLPVSFWQSEYLPQTLTLLRNYTGNTPFRISGGITVAAIQALETLVHPLFKGVCVNEEVELSAGIKDVTKVSELMCAGVAL